MCFGIYTETQSLTSEQGKQWQEKLPFNVQKPYSGKVETFLLMVEQSRRKSGLVLY